MGLWKIIVPEATTNFVLNPSGEETGNFSAHNGGSVGQAIAYSRHGFYSYSCGGGATNRGINLTLSALANAIHYVTFYARRATGSAFSGTLQASLNGGANWSTVTELNGSASDTTDRWARFGVQIPAAQANGSTSVLVRNTANESWYIDAVQVEQKTYATTYIDGSLPGGSWSGLYHASTSSRDAQYRLGGRIRDLYDDYGVGVYASSSGYGMPAVSNAMQSYSLQPGAEFAGGKTQIRYLNLQVDFDGTSLADYHADRKALIDLVKPDAARENQPIWIGYTGAHASRSAWAQFRYDGGLEGGGWTPFSEQAPLRMVAVDPFWYEDTQQAFFPVAQQFPFTGNYAVARKNGQWQNLGTGFDAIVRVVVADRQNGRVYFGGFFTTANGVTVNRVCYWDGSTFVPLGSGTVGVSGGSVHSLAVAPNGDLWVGGSFTAAGGSATHGIARWNKSTNTWSVFALGAGSVFYGLAISSTGRLYGGGNFLNWNGNANSDHIVSYDGSTWSALGSGMDNQVNEVVIDQNDMVYAGGVFTSPATRIARWNGSAWSALGSGLDGTVRALAVAPNGEVYAGGEFTTPSGYIGIWNGSSWRSLGVGVNNHVYTINIQESGKVFAGGLFTQAGGISLSDRVALWNGSSWAHLDVDLSGSTSVEAILSVGDDLHVAFGTSGVTESGLPETITNLGTATAYPLVVVNGVGSNVLKWMENLSSKQTIFWNLPINDGESITIDLGPGRKTIESSWRRPITNNPLENSDFANWGLLPGANSVTTFLSGSATSIALTWTPRHWSVDGVAT